MKRLFAALLLLPSLALAQNASRIAGVAFDPSGAVVPNAIIRITSAGSQQVVQLTTDVTGAYETSPLSPGEYQVRAEAPGFVPAESLTITLKPGEIARQDFTLRFSAGQQEVMVTAKAPAGEGAIETSPTNSLETLEIREVRESSAKDVGEALASLDGVWKIRKGGIANDVVIRGFQQGDINLTIDGMRIYEACPSQMDPAAYHVDLSAVDTVEVVKGPYDIRTFGGIGGSVQVITKRPPLALNFVPSVSAGSFNFYNPSSVATYAKGRIRLLGGYSYRRSDPYKTGSGRLVNSYANYNVPDLNHPAFDSHAGWARLDLELGHKQLLDLSLEHQHDGLTTYPTLAMDAIWDATDQYNAQWHARELSGTMKSATLQGYLTQVKQWMTDELRTSSVGAPLAYGMATISGARVLGGRGEVDFERGVAGAEVFSRGWDVVNAQKPAMGTGPYTQQAAMPQVQNLVVGLYTQFSRAFGKLYGSAGARLDVGKSRPKISEPYTDLYWAYHDTRTVSATDFGPSVNLRASYLLPAGHELYAGISSAMRLPDPEERFYALRRMGGDWVGNPDLKPTRNNEFDLGLNMRTRFVSLRPTAFYSILSDYVAINEVQRLHSVAGVKNTHARTYEGVPARFYGGETSYSVGFTRNLILNGGVSYTRAVQSAKSSAVMEKSPAAEIPPLKTRAALRYGNDVFFTEVRGLVTDRQNQVAAYIHEQRTPGYAVFDFKAGLHRKQWNISTGVDNLGNRLYYDHLSFQRDPDRLGVRIPDAGRAFYLNVSYRFE